MKDLLNALVILALLGTADRGCCKRWTFLSYVHPDCNQKSLVKLRDVRAPANVVLQEGAKKNAPYLVGD